MYEKISYLFLTACVVAVLIMLFAMPAQAVNWNSAPSAVTR